MELKYIETLKKLKIDISRIKKLETIDRDISRLDRNVDNMPIWFNVTRLQLLNLRALELLKQ